MIGPGILFPYGLAIGACISIVNLSVISVSIDRAIAKGKEGPVIIGFIVRILLYAGAVVVPARTSGISAVGAVVGLLLPHIVLYVKYGLIPWIRRKTGKEPETVYAVDTRSRMFIKEPWMIRYSKGRTYLTHRRYKKIRIEKQNGL